MRTPLLSTAQLNKQDHNQQYVTRVPMSSSDQNQDKWLSKHYRYIWAPVLQRKQQARVTLPLAGGRPDVSAQSRTPHSPETRTLNCHQMVFSHDKANHLFQEPPVPGVEELGED
ncbi:hypothetical protein STEG23_027001 [Scotinomys teguina]